MKNRVFCLLGRACHRLPGLCILLQVGAVLALAATLGYLFATQRLLIG